MNINGSMSVYMELCKGLIAQLFPVPVDPLKLNRINPGNLGLTSEILRNLQ